MNGSSGRSGVIGVAALLAVGLVAGTAAAGGAGREREPAVQQGKAKATLALVVARRDALLKGRDELLALAKVAAPKGLDAAGKKAFDDLVATVLKVAAGYDALATKLTDGLKAEKADAASMSEMSEMESLRLQMMMDRKAKEMTTLSNLLKKISDTASSITQNMK